MIHNQFFYDSLFFMTGNPISISEALITIKKSVIDTKRCSDIFNESLSYLEKFAKIHDLHATEDLRNHMAMNQFNEEEIAIIGSLLPTDAENIKKICPGLVRIDDSVIYKISDLINELI